MNMAQYRSKEEQLRLGEIAVDLRDVGKLKWRVIAEKLGSDISTIIVYYKKYKVKIAENAIKERMNLEQVEQFSIKHGIDRGWVWLYENGFKRRVPQEIKEEIEATKLRDW